MTRTGEQDESPSLLNNTRKKGRFLRHVHDDAHGLARELEADPRVNVCMQDKRRFVSVTGVARLMRDRALIDKLWSEAWRIWFPKGKDDPSLCIPIIEPGEAADWDA
jgi:general stress protein 26